MINSKQITRNYLVMLQVQCDQTLARLQVFKDTLEAEMLQTEDCYAVKSWELG